MGDLITYRAIEPGEEKKVSELVLESFEEFIRHEYSQEGIDEFRRYAQPEALALRSRADHCVLVATLTDRIAGVIEIRQHDHISLLFVDRRLQRKGIAKDLLQKALEVMRTAKPDLERVTVNSSRYGVPVYEKLGFHQTGPERTVNGIAFIPMVLRLAGS